MPDAEPNDLKPGPYAFVYQDAGGATLHEISFDASSQLGYVSLTDMMRKRAGS